MVGTGDAQAKQHASMGGQLQVCCGKGVRVESRACAVAAGCCESVWYVRSVLQLQA